MVFTTEMADVESATQPTHIRGRVMEYPMRIPPMSEDREPSTRKGARKMKGASMKGGKGMSKKTPFGKKPTSGTRKMGTPMD